METNTNLSNSIKIPSLQLLAKQCLDNNPHYNQNLIFESHKIVALIANTDYSIKCGTIWLTCAANNPVKLVVNKSIDDLINDGYLYFINTYPIYNGFRARKKKIDMENKWAFNDYRVKSSLIIQSALQSDSIYFITVTYTKFPYNMQSELNVSKVCTRKFSIYWHRILNIFTLQSRSLNVEGEPDRYPRFNRKWIPRKLFEFVPKQVSVDMWNDETDLWISKQIPGFFYV